MNGKQLLLIGIILSVLILCLPISAALYCDGHALDMHNCTTTWEGIEGEHAGDENWVYYWNSSMYSYGYPEQDQTTVYCGCSDQFDGILPASPWGWTYDFGQAIINCAADPKTYEVCGYGLGGDTWQLVTAWNYQIGETVIGEVDFTAVPITGDKPLSVLFTDNTTGFTPIDNYIDFGDGYTYSTGVFNPVIQHTYINDGYYDVKYATWDTGLAHFGWSNKTSYIHVTTASGNVTEGYNIYLYPSTLNYNQNFSISTTSTKGFGDIAEVRYGYTQGSNSNILDDKDLNILDYSNISGTWYQFNADTHSFDIPLASFPNSITLIPATFGSGQFIIDCYLIKTNGQVIHITSGLTITTVNQQTLTIQAIDFNDGYIVSSAHINVNDIASGIWDNRSVGGEKIFYYPYGQKLYIDVNSNSYYTSNKNYTVTSSPTNMVQVVMYRGINTPAGNVTLRVNVMDTLGGYLNNAKVTILNDESYFDSQSKYTNYAGVTTFTVLPNTDYVISVSKTGYLSAGKLINSGTGGLTLDTTIVLSVGSNPTATPTPLPTTAGGQYTGNIGGSNLTPVTCKTVLPQGSTLLDTLRNNMACAGITSGQNQGFGIALMIIFTLGVIGGKYGKGMGVVMGMSAGYVLSLAMNLVPLWTFIALLVFICLILAIKIWSSDK